MEESLLTRVSVENIYGKAEEQGEGNPDRRHGQRFPDRDFVLSLSCKTLEVDEEHEQDKEVETYPDPHGHIFKRH